MTKKSELPAENDDKSIQPSYENEELNTVIVLSNGAVASKKPLTGNHFFKFQSMALKNSADALKWVVMQGFLIDGEPLTIGMLMDMSFRDAATLTTEITKDFTAYQNPEKLLP